MSNSYYIQDKRIECVKVFKDLGVIFDEKLSFKPHLQHLISTSKSMTDLAYRLSKEVRSRFFYMKMVKTYIFPIIEYCSQIWSFRQIVLENKLEGILQVATRNVHGNFRYGDQRYMNFQTNTVMFQMKTFELTYRGLIRILDSSFTDTNNQVFVRINAPTFCSVDHSQSNTDLYISSGSILAELRDFTITDQGMMMLRNNQFRLNNEHPIYKQNCFFVIREFSNGIYRFERNSTYDDLLSIIN